LSRSDAVRLNAFRRLRVVAKWLTLVAIGLALVLVFVPPLQAKFTSDTFVGYERYWDQSPYDLLALFVPKPDQWYRPLSDIAFWLEIRAFGTEAIGYHLVALTGHIASTALVFLLTERLVRSRKAALCAALVFLANPHAQEPLWFIADLHSVLSAPILLTCLLVYSTGRRKSAWLLAVLALGVDEAGLLAIPMIGLYELIVACPTARWTSLKESLVRVTPFAIIAVAYLALRVLAGSMGDITEVSNVCRTPSCLAVAAGEYFNRLLVRPDFALESLWTHRWRYVALGSMAVVFVLLVARPWAWREKRIPVFLVAWLIVATSYYTLSLWPYIADRFLYLPDCALAVLIGVVAARAGDAWPEWSRVRRWAGSAAAVALVVWSAAGLWMLFNRGQLWIDAGQQAASIVREIHTLVPDPPRDAVFVFRNPPAMASPPIPPGNTGAYVFANIMGLDSAIRLEYGRSDLTVVTGDASLAAGKVFVFELRNGSVVQVP